MSFNQFLQLIQKDMAFCRFSIEILMVESLKHNNFIG